MEMGGRRPTVTDAEVLRHFAIAPDPVLFSTELTDALDMSQQGVYERLMALTEKDFLDTKKVGRCRVWWITQAGREHLASADS